MIVATAGHVDHGKTSLVKALTGIDTDRLPEEKRRGLSIDLGFAHADLGGDAPVGFVDVPGHERFVRNMLAGVAAVDLALLVVAADDGPMPQTHEHLAILRLLGVSRLAVALTKGDRVDAARLDAVGRDVDVLLAAHGLPPAPRFAVVAPRGEGIDALRRHLADCQRTLAARPAVGEFRLAIDRRFTRPGAGLVVTGAVFSGSAHVGETLVLSPQGIEVRVRAIRSHEREVDRAVAGQRCAMNLASGELRGAEVGRGDWLVAPAAHAPSARLDVRLQSPLPGARPLVDGARLQLHHGAGATMARLALLDARGSASDGRFAQLLLQAPVVACVGDRLVLRDPAAQATLAGAVVVDPFGAERGRARPPRLAQLAAMARPTAAEALRARLAAEPDGVPLARFERGWNLRPDEARALRAALPMQVVAVAGDELAVDVAAWQRWQQRVAEAVTRWHAAQPGSVGPGEPELARELAPGMRAGALRALLSAMAADGRLVREGARWRAADHVPRLDAADTAMLSRVREVLEGAGLRPPIVGELATTLGVALPELLTFLEHAARLGHLVRVAKNRYFLPGTVDALVAIAARLAESHPDGFDAAAFRDASGIGRNLTIELLEHLDAVGVTRFRGGRRRLAG